MSATTRPPRAQTNPVATREDGERYEGTEQLPVYSWEVESVSRIHPRLISRRATPH